MKLVGNLKKQVEAAATKDEAREAIRNAGMVLNDDELDQVAGGSGDDYCNCEKPDVCYSSYNGKPWQYCKTCGKTIGGTSGRGLDFALGVS